MSDNKKTWIVLLAGLFLVACQTMYVPDAYNFSVKESKVNPYGYWTVVTFKADPEKLAPEMVAGELICIDSDTLYLLESDSLVWPIYARSVVKAELFTHKNQTGTYAALSSLLLVPNIIGALTNVEEYGGGFLAIGIPTALIGLSRVLAESKSHDNILVYPEKNRLENFKLYARFPAGKPENVDFNQLTLKRSF